MIEYDILSSGSKGNATVINGEILIDCGVPARSLSRYIKTLRLVLLTHQHGDHLNPAAIRYLALERPSLRFICGPWLYDRTLKAGALKLQVDRMLPGETAVYNAGRISTKPGYEITMAPAKHDVPNCGYKVILPSGEKLFYMTDTNTLDSIVAKGFDLYMLEANWEEAGMRERITAAMESGQYQYEWRAIENHLSKEKADNWLYQNMGPNSQYIYLHCHEDIDSGGVSNE